MDDCYRNLFFDFHNNELVKGIAAEFNAEKWAEQLKDVGVQCVNVFTNDMFGWKYYRKGEKGFIHPNLPEGLDMVEDTVKACHNRGIKVLAYYAPQRPAFIRDTNPEWMMRDAKGTLPKGVQNSLCKLGPVGREELLPQVKEITRLYDVDGVYFDGTYAFGPCYCDYCREAFKRDMGFDIPIDTKTFEYKRYIKWLLDKHTEFKRNIAAAAHQGNPNVKVMDNWAYTYRLSEKMPDEIDALKCDIEPANQLFHASMTARSFALTGKPFFVQNTGFLKWWGEWGIKPAATLKQECATILANGGRTFIGYQLHPKFMIEKAVMDTFKEVFNFVREREEICKGSSIEPYIGAFYSTTSRGVTHGAEVWPDLKPMMGIHKLCSDIGLHYNLLSDQHISRDIGKFKVVILSDMRYMSNETVKAVREYVENGGSLIATGLSGTLDDKLASANRFLIEDLLGVALVGNHPDSHAYMEITDESIKTGTLDMPMLVETAFFYIKPIKAKVLATLRGLYKRSDGAYLLRYSPPGEDTGYPSVTINEYGKGKVVYLAGDIFTGYYTSAQWNLAYMLKNILYNHLIKDKLIEVIGPNTVEVVLARKQGKEIVHLINTTGEMPAFGTTDICCITRNTIPLYNLKVKVFLREDPIKVNELPGNKNLFWVRERDVITIEVPKLDVHCCIEITLKANQPY